MDCGVEASLQSFLTLESIVACSGTTAGEDAMTHAYYVETAAPGCPAAKRLHGTEAAKSVDSIENYSSALSRTRY